MDALAYREAETDDPPRALQRPAVVDTASDEVIDEVVRELNDLHRGAALETALRIGELIVRKFYNGDLTAWRTHSAKEASFRKLAARADRDLCFSATALWRAVALFEITTRLNLKHARLGVTHLRLVLGLPDAEQRRLLVSAEKLDWSTERLEQETARLRGRVGIRAGRRAAPLLLRAVRSLIKDTERIQGCASSNDDLRSLSRDELRALYSLIDDTKAKLDQVQRKLAAGTH